MGRMIPGRKHLEVLRLRFEHALYAVLLLSYWVSFGANAQTASTGAVTGITLDPAGLAVPGVTVQLVSVDLLNVG